MGPIFKIHLLFLFLPTHSHNPLISCRLLVAWYSNMATSPSPQRFCILFLKWRMTRNPSPFSIFANRFKNQGAHLIGGIIRYQVFFNLSYWNDVKMKGKQIWVDFLSIGSEQSPWGVLIIAWPFWMCIFPFFLIFWMLDMLISGSKHLLISWLQSPSAVILEPKKIKSATVSTVSPSICHEVMGLDAMILVFWMLSFKPTFSLSSFTFIKGLFSSSLSSIRVVSSAYLRLLIFLPAILTPTVLPPVQRFSWCTLHIS